ncbi:MAG: deoxyribose-phosphate aldolase [Clostridia bacterium]|nr:deoxyribose-phosphate aldolase [Clostridia bacterium]MDD4047648.1 deoxyribose-phosphate aldolase [Clostridia bacterium]
MYSLLEVLQSIDNTLLKPDLKDKDYIKFCEESKEQGFKAVCVLPYYVPLCVEQLKNSCVSVVTVIGFPLGANSSEVKAFETKKAFIDGAVEVDMVINIGALKDKKTNVVYDEIKKVVDVAGTFSNKLVKVIIETSLLTDEEKILACKIAVEAGVDFVKTSTGFNGAGATVEDIKLINSVVREKAKVKASGGIRTWEKAEKLLLAGANRIGTSKGKLIIDQYKEKEDNVHW